MNGERYFRIWFNNTNILLRLTPILSFGIMQYISSWNKRKDWNACYRILLKICHITLESFSKMQQQKMLMQRSRIFFKMLLKIAASIRCIPLIAYHKHSLLRKDRELHSSQQSTASYWQLQSGGWSWSYELVTLCRHAFWQVVYCYVLCKGN